MLLKTYPRENDRPFSSFDTLEEKLKIAEQWLIYKSRLAENHMKQLAFKRFKQASGANGAIC